MKRPPAPHHLGLLLSLSAGLIFACAQAVFADEPPPQVSKDGLQLVKQTKERLVYLRPGAKFSQYDRVAVLDCYVEFQKNWARDYNSETVSLNQQVTDDDIKRMKSALAAEFKRVFVTELTKGGYQVVDAAAPDVLVLRPALVNVQVTAPDLMTPGINGAVVRSAGSATLYLELWDSSTNTILARVLDAKADQQPFAQPANRVTNTAAADRILTSWANDLVRHLNAARGKTS
jgi:hypothetical protein